MTAAEGRALMVNLDRPAVEAAIRSIYGEDADVHLYVPLIAPMLAGVRKPITSAEISARLDYVIDALR